MTTEDVEELCMVSHVGDGMTHSTAHPSDFCMSPWQIDFQISLEKFFVLATFMAPRSSNINGLVHVPSDVSCHCFVDWIAGHSSGKYHISV